MNMRAISVFAMFTVCVLCSAQTEIPELFATESDGNIETIQDNTEETRTPRSLAVNRDLMRAKEILAKVGHHCTASKNNLAAAKAQIAKHTNAVHKALNVAKKICKKEKEMARRSAEKKKKHKARGATFKFDTGKPCKGGKGDFKMKLKQDQRVVVGKIPANMKDVWVKLRTDKDVDTELWTANGKREIAIVAWRVGKIDSPTAASVKYAGGTIKYSGYNGIASKNGALNFGHEDIEIVGKSKSAFVMKAFAFETGTAKVYYSWGADPVKCKAQKAKRRQEKKKKHNAKVAMKKRLSEKDYKKALKVAQGVAKNCGGANNYTKAMRVALKKAIQLVEGHKIKLQKCHKNKEKYSKHLHQLDAKEKKYKEGDAKESRMKKERAIKREKMNKERAQKYAKEQKNKESKAKEGAFKVERAAKEKSAKERNAKEQARKREMKGKEKSQKAEAAAKEKSAKERNGKERAKKREHKNKEAAAKAKERHDKAVKKERKAKADERRSKELSSKEQTSKERTTKERKNKAERAHKERVSKEQSQKKERASKERAKKESASKESTNKERAGKERTNKERAGKAERSHKERSYKQERTNKERSSKQYRARNTCTVWAYEHNNYRGRVMRQHSYCGPGRQDIRFHRMYRRRRGFHASSFKLSSGSRQVQLWDEDSCRYGYGDNMNIRSSTSSVTWDLNDDTCGMSIWSTAGHNC
jgi:hypothetical protein